MFTSQYITILRCLFFNTIQLEIKYKNKSTCSNRKIVKTFTQDCHKLHTRQSKDPTMYHGQDVTIKLNTIQIKDIYFTTQKKRGVCYKYI